MSSDSGLGAELLVFLPCSDTRAVLTLLTRKIGENIPSVLLLSECRNYINMRDTACCYPISIDVKNCEDS